MGIAPGKRRKWLNAKPGTIIAHGGGVIHDPEEYLINPSYFEGPYWTPGWHVEVIGRPHPQTTRAPVTRHIPTVHEIEDQLWGGDGLPIHRGGIRLPGGRAPPMPRPRLPPIRKPYRMGAILVPPNKLHRLSRSARKLRP